MPELLLQSSTMESQQMDVLLSNVSDVIDSKLVSSEVKILKQERQQHEQQMRKIQTASDKLFVFKRKGNEAMLKFNNAVREKMVQANTHINDGEAEAAFKSVNEFIELIDT
jgi:histidinol dehydrogenase